MGLLPEEAFDSVQLGAGMNRHAKITLSGGARRSIVTPLEHAIQCSFVDSKERAGGILHGDDGEDTSGPYQELFDHVRVQTHIGLDGRSGGFRLEFLPPCA